MKNYSFTFNPQKKGLRQVFGDLEVKIMEILWNKGEGSVKEVYTVLKDNRDIAYTTVMTVMSRLAEKGILQKRKWNNAYQYNPAVSKQDFKQITAKNIMKSLFEDFTSPTINQFLDYLDDDPEKLDELAKLIEKRRKTK